MKFCMRVGLLSRQVFSPLMKTGSRGVTAAALLPALPTELGAVAELAPDSTGGDLKLCAVARWAFGIGGGSVA